METTADVNVMPYKNKQKANECNRIRYAKNIEKERERGKAYYEKHKEEVGVRHRATHKRRLKIDPVYRLEHNLRRRANQALTGGYKCTAIKELLGASYKVVHEYLTNLLKPGMTWENYGRDTWHIDHIIPCAAFDLTDLAQQKKCFHYTNLQPLWATDNHKKHAKLNYETTKDVRTVNS